MFRTIESETLKIICPTAKLVADTEAPLLYSIWLDDDIIGAGEDIGHALRDASETLREWEVALDGVLAWRSFKREDWWAFAGSVSFDDGSEPRIASIVLAGQPGCGGLEGVVVHDAQGIAVMFDDCERCFAVPAESINSLKQIMSLDALRAIPGIEEL